MINALLRLHMLLAFVLASLVKTRLKEQFNIIYMFYDSSTHLQMALSGHVPCVRVLKATIMF